MTTKLQPVPKEVSAAIRKHSMIAYLWDRSEAQPYTTSKACRATTVDARSKLLMTTVDIPAGTEGWLFTRDDISYSAYQQVDDMDYPAKGATRFVHGRHYTFVTILPDGRLAHSYSHKQFKPALNTGTV